MSLGPVSGSLAGSGVRPLPGSARGDRADDERSLKASANAMEALFVQQLFQAMRTNIPSDGLIERNAGEDLFNSLLDQSIAEQVAARESGDRDLSTGLFDALRERLAPRADTPR